MKIPSKINLANIPTPVQKVKFEGCNFLIKRDDFTGVELSGNKIRKLEYLLSDAKKKKVDYIFTCGGDQSNHARATCIAAASLGMKTKLFLWGKENQKKNGNLFLDEIAGAEFEYLTFKEYLDVDERMLKEKGVLEKKNKTAYVIPSGGSSNLGIWGYINFIKELNEQLDLKKIKGIVLANGSSGTAAGIILGCSLLNIKMKIFPVNVLQSKDEVLVDIEKLVYGCMQDYKLKTDPNFDNLEILDGYSNEGYKKISENKIRLIKKFFSKTGILLDPTYTGKAFKAYYDNFLQNKKKTDILFLHTGGIFGAFAKKKNYLDY